jgi:hypothetical protein
MRMKFIDMACLGLKHHGLLLLALAGALALGCDDDTNAAGDGGARDTAPASDAPRDTGAGQGDAAGDGSGGAGHDASGDAGPGLTDASPSADHAPAADAADAAAGGPDASADQGGSSADGPSAANGGYSAHYWPGGLDHLEIAKVDSARGLCFRLRLDAPSGANNFLIDVPAPWTTSIGLVATGGTGCAASMALPASNTRATSGAGSVRWTGYRPCEIDLDVTLYFAGAPAGVPAMEVLRASRLPVPGC